MFSLAHYFWRHILVGSADLYDLFVLVELAAPSKVAEFCIEVAVENDVFGLDISMNDTLFVQILDGSADLEESSDSQRFRKSLFRVDIEEQTAV